MEYVIMYLRRLYQNIPTVVVPQPLRTVRATMCGCARGVTPFAMPFSRMCALCVNHASAECERLNGQIQCMSKDIKMLQQITYA